jgi:hypothetical protein
LFLMQALFVKRTRNFFDWNQTLLVDVE